MFLNFVSITTNCSLVDNEEQRYLVHSIIEGPFYDLDSNEKEFVCFAFKSKTDPSSEKELAKVRLKESQIQKEVLMDFHHPGTTKKTSPKSRGKNLRPRENVKKTDKFSPESPKPAKRQRRAKKTTPPATSGKSDKDDESVSTDIKGIDIRSFPSAKKKRLTTLVGSHIVRGASHSESLVKWTKQEKVQSQVVNFCIIFV